MSAIPTFIFNFNTFMGPKINIFGVISENVIFAAAILKLHKLLNADRRSAGGLFDSTIWTITLGNKKNYTPQCKVQLRFCRTNREVTLGNMGRGGKRATLTGSEGDWVRGKREREREFLNSRMIMSDIGSRLEKHKYYVNEYMEEQ